MKTNAVCAGQLILGSKLGGPLPLNPLLAAGWAALLANALNCIPVGGASGQSVAIAISNRCRIGFFILYSSASTRLHCLKATCVI